MFVVHFRSSDTFESLYTGLTVSIHVSTKISVTGNNLIVHKALTVCVCLQLQSGGDMMLMKDFNSAAVRHGFIVDDVSRHIALYPPPPMSCSTPPHVMFYPPMSCSTPPCHVLPPHVMFYPPMSCSTPPPCHVLPPPHVMSRLVSKLVLDSLFPACHSEK